jgi:hypothetical protein
MASWLVQEKRASVVMIELLEKATRSSWTASSRPQILVLHQRKGTVQREIPQALWIEPVALRLAAEKQVVRAKLLRGLFARPE